MTDLASHKFLSRSKGARSASWSRVASWRAVLYGGTLLTVMAVSCSTHPAAVAVQADLVVLLRFMAAMKFVMAFVAVALTHWRLGHPLSASLAAFYIAATTAMVAGATFIWSLERIGLGAALFHSGLFLFLFMAWRDCRADARVGRIVRPRDRSR